MIWLSSFLAVLSLLAVFKAPAFPLMLAALVVTEAGHWLALASVLCSFVSWRLMGRWSWPSALALAATVLFLTPLCRALWASRQLPSHLTTVFGSRPPRSEVNAPFRIQPLAFADLIRGVYSPAVQVSSHTYFQREKESLELDLYRPQRIPGKLPVVLIVHGGSWQRGDRSEFTAINHYLAARGYAVASIDYRLAPRWMFPAQRDDVFAAIHYLRKHAQELQLDLDQIVLFGRSAGGQIALSAGYLQKEPGIKGVIVWYAPNDLAWAYAIPTSPLILDSQQVLSVYLGGTPTERPDAYAAASPLLHVNKTTPPTLMLHGGRDEMVWDLHEVRLSERLAQAGRPYFFLRLPWATHGCDAYFSGPSGQLSTYTVERFLAAILPPRTH